MAPIDLDLFVEHTRGRSVVEVLLRGHLWLENAVIDLIEADVANPAPLKLDRMTFSNKVNLAEALGLLGPGDAATLRAFNKIRNRLAHDLHGEPTPEDLQTLQRCLSPSQLDLASEFDTTVEYRNTDPDTEHIGQLSTITLALLCDIEIHRQMHVYWKQHRKSMEGFQFSAAVLKGLGITNKFKTWDDFRAHAGIPAPPTPADVMIPRRGPGEQTADSDQE